MTGQVAGHGPACTEIPLGDWRRTAPGGSVSAVTPPDTVARQPWQEWDPARWEAEWDYRTAFDLPGPVAGARTFLRFAGALTAIAPELNGHRLPPHRGGYLPAEYEVTGQVRPRHNVLDVRLDGRFDVNVPPNRPGSPAAAVDFWQPAGLYREVTLRVLPPVFLADVVAVPRAVLDPGARHLEVTATVDAAFPAGEALLELSLEDGGRALAATTVPVSLAPPGRHDARADLRGLGEVRLWELDEPVRYRLRARLVTADAAVHEYTVPVGFRSAEFTTGGFFLNGRGRTLFGLNRHQLYPYVGGAMPPRVQRADARILERLNCSVVRCSHYPQHEAFLDACDELGILVFDEVPGWQHLGDAEWRDLVRRDVRAMIRRDRHHPSVVLWGVRLNETPGDAELYADTRRIARELDGSRATTGAVIGTGYATTDFQQDVFAYNDYASTGDTGTRLPRLLPPREDRPYLVSEAVGTLSGPATYYRRTDSVADQHGQALAHALVHEQAAADPRHCGVLGWSGFDYPSGTGHNDRGVKYTGVVDLFRVPKPGAAAYAAQVDPRRRAVIEPAFYWDFAGDFSVRTLGADALIFANAGRLELIVGDEPYATLYPDLDRFGHLPYPPFVADFSAAPVAELRVDAYVGDRLVHSRRFSPDRAADRLRLAADDGAVDADGADATRVEMRVVDRYGAPRPVRTGTVRLHLEGPAELLGDNPFPIGETGGAAAVWLRGLPGRPGVARLRAEHETLPAAEVTVAVGDTGAPSR